MHVMCFVCIALLMMQDFNHGDSNYITCKPQINSTLVYCHSSSTSSFPGNVRGTGKADCIVEHGMKVISATVVITYAAGFSIQRSTTFKGYFLKECLRINFRIILVNVCISIRTSRWDILFIMNESRYVQ